MELFKHTSRRIGFRRVLAVCALPMLVGCISEMDPEQPETDVSDTVDGPDAPDTSDTVDGGTDDTQPQDTGVESPCEPNECHIGGACRPAGQLGTSCRTCDPSRSTTSWSNAAVDTPCKDDFLETDGETCGPVGKCRPGVLQHCLADLEMAGGGETWTVEQGYCYDAPTKTCVEHNERLAGNSCRLCSPNSAVLVNVDENKFCSNSPDMCVLQLQCRAGQCVAPVYADDTNSRDGFNTLGVATLAPGDPQVLVGAVSPTNDRDVFVYRTLIPEFQLHASWATALDEPLPAMAPPAPPGAKMDVCVVAQCDVASAETELVCADGAAPRFVDGRSACCAPEEVGEVSGYGSCGSTNLHHGVFVGVLSATEHIPDVCPSYEIVYTLVSGAPVEAPAGGDE